jgi:hypothetical protein
MAEVYSQAYFTIAAANAENSEVGIFREISSERLARPYLRLETSNASPGDDESEHQALMIYAQRQSKYRRESSVRYRLMNRAWTYQERYLSPRVIYFLEDELGWSCQSLDDDESHSGTFSSFTFALDKKRNPYAHHEERSSSGEANEEDYYYRNVEHWHYIVNDYGKLALSFEKDKLPALAGLAKHVSPHRKGRYLAGLWEDSLIVDLLWKIYDWPRKRPAITRAPTWSWASCDGAAYRYMEGATVVKELSTILHVETVPVGADPMGEVTGGTLVIRGPLLLDVDLYEFRPDTTEAKEIDSSERLYLPLCHFTNFRSAFDGSGCLVVTRVHDGQNLYERIGFARSKKWIEFEPETVRTITIM